MKVIFLNAWNGKVRDGITQFLKDQSRTTDVFCLQEAYDEMKRLAENILPDHNEVGAYKHMANDIDFSPATYIRKDIPFLHSETILESESGLGFGFSVQVRLSGKDMYICNVHGTTRQADDKLDDPARLKQSRAIIEFFKEKSGPKIIGGDFNILPETKSMHMFEENGYRDLIKEFNVSSTRNRLALERYPGHKEYFSDYAFVSPDVKLKSFSVPDLEISDHLPLVLEVEI